MEKDNKSVLEFVYNRLIHEYNQPESDGFMVAFKKVIDEFQPPSSKDVKTADEKLSSDLLSDTFDKEPSDVNHLTSYIAGYNKAFELHASQFNPPSGKLPKQWVDEYIEEIEVKGSEQYTEMLRKHLRQFYTSMCKFSNQQPSEGGSKEDVNTLERQRLPGTEFVSLKQWLEKKDDVYSFARFVYLLAERNHRRIRPFAKKMTEDEINTSMKELYKEWYIEKYKPDVIM